MALVAHWPLNGDLLDYSGNGYNLKTVGDMVISNDGKLGKCYSMYGRTRYVYTDSQDFFKKLSTMLSDDGAITISMWIKNINDATVENSCGLYGTYKEGVSRNRAFELYAYSIPENFHISCYRLNSSGDSTTLGYNHAGYFTRDTWVHSTVVYKKNKVIVYRNGERLGESTNTSVASIEDFTNLGLNFCIGTNDNSSNAQFKFNDFRVFNHELSLNEVKELYKTKILDWKMNESGEPTTNILPNSWQFINYDVGSEADFISQLSRDISFGVVLKRKIYSKSMEYRGNNRIYRKIAVSSGNQYTFSAWIYSDVAKDLLLRYELFGGDYTWQGDGVRHNGTGWEYLSITTPILTSNCDLYFMFYGVGHDSSVYINAMQLELGSRSNNYVLTNRDGKVIDSSGFKNHGLIETGSSPRYSNGEYLLRVNDGLSKITSDIVLPKTFTVIYQSYDDNGYRASSDRWHIGQSESTSSSTIGWAYSQGYGEDMGYTRICNSEGTIHSTRIGSSNITINKYENNAFIFNYESGEISSYLNGNILGTLAYGNSDTALNLSKFSVGSSYTNNNRISGKLKNVRVYATALSKGDIDKIFSNEISIDKKYNILCSEIIEEENMFSLKRVTMGNLTTTAFTYTKNYSDMSITLKNDGGAGSARMNFTKAVLMPLYGIDFLLSFKLKGILNPDFVPTDFNDGGFLEKRFIYYEKLGYYEWILKVNTVNINDVYQFLDFNIGANCEILLYDFKLMPLTSVDNINFTNNGKIIVASINEIDFTDNFNITNTYELICNSFSEV